MTTDPSSDVERVARAIAASFESGSPDIAKNMRMDWQTWVPEARAAIAAMPTIERLSAERMQLREAARIAAQAFRTLEEVAVAQLEHDKARNFIRLGDICRAALMENGPTLDLDRCNLCRKALRSHRYITARGVLCRACSSAAPSNTAENG